MDDGKLPSEYDVIILGTGMTECILAAAFARVGQKVLHLDRNDYYSGDWATFNFKALQEWINGSTDRLKKLDSIDLSSILKEGEKILPLNVQNKTITNVSQQYYIRKSAESSTSCDPVAEESPSCDSVIEESPSPSCDSVIEESPSQELAEEESPSNDPSASASSVNSENISSQASADIVQSVQADDDVQPAPQTKAEQTHEDIPVGNADADNPESVTDEAYTDTATKDTKNTAVVTDTSQDESTQWSVEKIEKLWRKFNIDMMPKILYSRGPLVELLISSDIAKYCEFRSITRILTKLKGVLQQVPCSRSDVFSSKQVNMIEKRMLMKLLTFCVDYEDNPNEYQGYEDKTFLEFLRSKKLTPNVLHYVKSAIAMATDSTGTLEGLKNTQKFLRSLGRYGNTAFLWPLYGSGEIPQCFCRMCAVFGGVYCLRRTGQSVIVDGDNVVQGIVDTEGQRLSAKWLIMEASYASESILPMKVPQKRLSRAILLTDRTIFHDSNLHITLMSLPPPEGGSSPITLYELSSLSVACPDDLYVIQLICESCSGSAKADLSSAISCFFDWDPEASGNVEDHSEDPPPQHTTCDKPKVLWSLFFNIADNSQIFIDGGEDINCMPNHLYVVGGPSADLDMDLAIHQAKTLFDRLCPGEEFIPRAPNPEDIIFDGVDGSQEEAGGFREEQGSKGEDGKELKDENGEGKSVEKEEDKHSDCVDKEEEGEDDEKGHGEKPANKLSTDDGN